MPLTIIDDTENKLISRSFFEDLNHEANDLRIFRGVTFNVSWNFIKKHLLKRFDKIELLIGLTGSKESRQTVIDNLNSQNLNVSHHLQQDLTSLDRKANQEIRQRILDGSLVLRYTQKALIHTKMYFLTDTATERWRLYTGSMNLSEAAVNSNYELLSCKHGDQKDVTYHLYEQVFNEIKANSTNYLNARTVRGWDNLDKQNERVIEKYVVLESGQLDYLPKKNLTSKDNRELHNEITTLQVNLKREATVSDAVLKIKQQLREQGITDSALIIDNEELLNKSVQALMATSGSENELVRVRKESDLYPKPMLTQNGQDSEIWQADKYDDEAQLLKINRPTKADVASIFEIVKFYRDQKQDDESQAAFSFLMYVLESGAIWKIRQVIDQHNGITEDIPIAAALIGQGMTGKTTLLKIASNLTIGNTDSIIDANTDLFKIKDDLAKKINPDGTISKKNFQASLAKTSTKIMSNIWTFVANYEHTDSSIVPICLDDPEVSLLSSKFGQSTLKELANQHGEALHVQPVAIFGMNTKGKELELLPEVGRRVYVISQGNQFKKIGPKETAFFNYLDGESLNSHRLNNRLFLYLTKQIENWLNQINNDELALLKQDFLYPVKRFFKQLVEIYGLDTSENLAFIDQANYDLKQDVGRHNWSILLHNENVLHNITFTRDDPECTIAHDAFPRGVRDINKYFGFLPPDAEISKSSSEAGLSINFRNMDRWLGGHLLENRYREVTGIQQEQLEMDKARLSAQTQGDAVKQSLDPYMTKQSELMDRQMHVMQKMLERQEQQASENDEETKRLKARIEELEAKEKVQANKPSLWQRIFNRK